MNTVYIAFGLFLLITAYNYLKPKEARNYTSLNIEVSHEMIDNDDTLMILDVRNREEYKNEHIRNAKNIPLDQLEERTGKLPRNKDILIYCQNGGRSIRAIRKLELAGFTRLYHMHQGLRGWNKKSYPTTKTRKTT